MHSRRRTGAKGEYLCSRIVYCGNCGAKMHASTPRKNGHAYSIYTCSSKCGFGSVRAELVDEAAKMYLRELLTDEVQREIEKALRQYIRTEKDRVKEHNAVVKRQTAEKQKQIDALVDNLASGKLPPEVVGQIGEKIAVLKQEIEALSDSEPPRDYTTEQIIAWLNGIREAPDETAVRLLIERIEVKKDKEKATTEFSVISTLNSVVAKSGCGGGI
nr:zinc ribbon domain-containing protein [Butyricicoccus faecihominis]